MVINVHRRRDAKYLGRYRCVLNGRDVTDQTQYVDGRRGVVRMLVKNEDGQFVADGDDIARVERRGRVRLVRKAN